MATVMNINHFSIYLKRNMECTVILPSDMKNDEKLPVAAVLPNVQNSCFVNMNIGDKYESYVGKELFNIIMNMFPCLSNKRENNYVSGFSNGGYGCLHIALKYPEKYEE